MSIVLRQSFEAILQGHLSPALALSRRSNQRRGASSPCAKLATVSGTECHFLAFTHAMHRTALACHWGELPWKGELTHDSICAQVRWDINAVRIARRHKLGRTQ